MAWLEHDYPDDTALANAVAERLHEALIEAQRQGRWGLLSLAGGRSPLPIYRRLASMPDILWRQTVLVPGDDRCVAHDQPASNVSSLKAAFAQAPQACIEALTTVDGDADASLAHARSALAPLHGLAFDAVVLGMGEDAHTASLFPGATTLPAAMAPDAREDAFPILPDPLPPEAPYPRISLGLARLLRARAWHLVVTGARKRDVLRAAQAKHDPLRLPISALLHAPEALVHIHWSP